MVKTYENSTIEFNGLDIWDFKDIESIIIGKNVNWYWSDIEFYFKNWSSEWYSFSQNGVINTQN